MKSKVLLRQHRNIESMEIVMDGVVDVVRVKGVDEYWYYWNTMTGDAVSMGKRQGLVLVGSKPIQAGGR